MSLHDIWRGDVMPLSGVAVAIGRNSFDPPAPTVPVFDIHARSLVFHDSGPGSRPSGILYYRSSGGRQRLELIPAGSGARAIVTAVYIDVYDDTGGNSIGTRLTTVAFDTTRTNSHEDIFVFDDANDQIHINHRGVYVFEYRVTMDNATTVRTTSETRLERRAPGGAYAQVAGTLTFGYHRTTTDGEGSVAAKIILNNVVAGDTFRVRSQIIAGTTAITQVLEASSFTIRKIG